MFGLDGGLTSGVPIGIVVTTLARSLGEATSWLVLFCVFPVAAVGASRLTGGWRWGRLAAATLYCVNPWVFNRIYAGQIGLLFGYALLPYAVISALRATGHWPGPRERETRTVADVAMSGASPQIASPQDTTVSGGPAARIRSGRFGLGPSWVERLSPVLWWAVLTAIAPHYVWIYGLVLVAVVVVTRPFTWRLVTWLAGSTAAMVVLLLYILLPHSATQLPTRVGTTSLDIYRTTPDPHLGLLPNVAALYGFWRLGARPVLPKDVVTGWPLLMAAMLVVIVTGYWGVLRRAGGQSTGPGDEGHLERRAERRRVAWVLVVVGVAGYFLALGSQGPTGAIFRWAYDSVPFFAIMREPQKFLMLTALAYAVGLGWGVEHLARGRSPSRRTGQVLMAAALGIVLPLAYTPTIFDGLAGQIAPSTIPPAYHQADQLMGDGPGRILYLPWHLYEAQPFTGGRVVASPGSSLFRRYVISGDNVQVGAVQTQSTSLRGAYLTELYGAGPKLTHFGADVAPLGVKYVVLAKTVDWRSYLWLEHQHDLRLVLDDPTLMLWRNLSYRGVGERPGTTRPVRQRSLVAYQVPPGAPGVVRIDAAYQEGWMLDGVRGRPTPQGTVEFVVGRAGGIAQFRPWGLVKLGDALSGGAFVVLAAGVAWERWRRRARSRQGVGREQPAR